MQEFFLQIKSLYRMPVFVSCAFFFEPLCNLYEIPAGVLRGTEHSLYPAVATISGTCCFRIAWICTVFRHYHQLNILYYAFPISWVLTILLIAIGFIAKSQIRCFDLSGFGASYSSLLPDVISLPQFPFFIVFSAKCHITFIGTQHDLCAFPHDFSVGISCIALCTFPAPSEYWQISSFPSPRI